MLLRLACPIRITLWVFLWSVTTLLVRAELPPLLDRQLIFGNPEIASAQLSPDGKYVAFLKPYKDTLNIWVKSTNEPFTRARLLTDTTARPIRNFFWTRDGRFILYVQDRGGDENFNLYAVDPTAEPADGRDAPLSRDLTGIKGARVQIYAVPKGSPDVVCIGLNDRDPAWHDVYQLRLSTGERTRLRENKEQISGWFFDEAGQLRLAVRVAPNGDTEILRVDADRLVKVYACSVFESAGPIRMHPDGQRVYMVTNRGQDVDLTRLVLFDPKTGKEELVESDPLERVDFGSASFSDVTNDVIATVYIDERIRTYWRDKGYERDHRWLQKRLPGKDIAFTSGTRDEQIWLVTATSDTEPGETYLFDRRAKRLTLQYRLYEKLDRRHLAPMKAIRYPSSDGLGIPAYLTLPKGITAKNLPLMVVPHGGPWARDVWGYNRQAQFLANRGYAVLQPNFRASTGYGKRFLNAGNGQWGDLMQDDLTWGVNYLVAEGIADPRRVGIMGGSYGGYATLAGVAFTPKLYAAGVAIVAPSNLITLLNTIPPYWEAARRLFHTRMGDPGKPEDRARMERQSPLNAADRIETPLMIVQGANDPRVKKSEADQIVVALRDRGFPVEYLCAPDEGHGFARPVNNLALYAASERFLADHLKGRFQADMPADVAARLKEITVDVSTVTAPERGRPATVGVVKPESDLRAGRLRYRGTIDVPGQTIQATVETTVTEAGDAWEVREEISLPMGSVIETTKLEKASLVVRSRRVAQGPLTVDVAFRDGRVEGAVTLNGTPRPMAADLGGELLADGAGRYLVIGRLPLAMGYTATLRNFNVQNGRPSLVQLNVAAIENVSLASGHFTAYRVELTDEGGARTTVWVDQATRLPIKAVVKTATLGGAAISLELVESDG
ncbi:S9 family peptidase [Chloracidobacterium validum]|uniref:S9 family peptidase n=1 Tax=Chloracidobacterium validum TaxID=2821543 RepID=A0ABX8BA80_9BACT|nr:S9 family peptidase [Chloracidobacterium validum]QUW03833.1 S9 family peptidase [Chloracidobacterium validum]